jgi:peptidyl-prolyl cis-trans isomerase C
MRAVLKEPFVHFLLLGALLFGVNQYLEARSKFTNITITPHVVNGIRENYRLQYGVEPTATQLESLVDAYVREEVFYHAALRLGLDKDDEIIRRRLVQKYEFVQQDLDLAQEPTEQELRAYFEAQSQRYQLPGKVSFTHVYFSPDGRGEEGARAEAARVAAALNKSRAVRAPEAGDQFPGPVDIAALSREELGRLFGKEGLASEVFALKTQQWSEPLRSGLGWHVVYVNAQQPPVAESFAAARETVRRDFLDALRAERNAQTYAKLRSDFVIVRE